MSRAFVSEKGDWSYCREKQDTCIYAGEGGKCIFSACRIEEDTQPENQKLEQEEK